MCLQGTSQFRPLERPGTFARRRRLHPPHYAFEDADFRRLSCGDLEATLRFAKTGFGVSVPSYPPHADKAMAIDHKTERANDVVKIRDSASPKKVIVAGPGTGKSHLFKEVIKKKRAEGKTKFLAITFIGKLGDALADDLCGLARTTTMHGFAREFVLKQCGNGWVYYPRMGEIIKEDLKAEQIEAFQIGDENYTKRTKHYRAVGDADVVHYAIEICKKDPAKIPLFDLVLIDEYQDFNEIESAFVDVLASKNEVIIVGDDDQALYGFKGSSPDFIRAKYDPGNAEYESHTLRFCSRCTEVILSCFHSLVAKYDLNRPEKGRVQKEYLCYLPDKTEDSKANPKILLLKQCPVGMIAYKIRGALEDLASSQKIKDVLVIGEGRSCESLLKGAAQQLKNYGFRNVDYRGDATLLPVQQTIVDAYRFLGNDEASLIGWRILGNPAAPEERKKHIKNVKTLKSIVTGTPSELEKLPLVKTQALEEAIESWPAESDPALREQELRKAVLIRELKHANIHLPRPLCNLDITVCNILNSKGLGADVVFLIGFDEGRFPSKKDPAESEVYQMLVAVTRAKKRLYLVNTIGKAVSGFVDCIDAGDLDVEQINTGQ